jgi:L-aminopeptidase/D-esterase-like protein
MASVSFESITVGALVVVNALGNVVLPGTDTIVAGARDIDGHYRDSGTILLGSEPYAPPTAVNTTLGVLATDVALSPEQINHLASVAHDGLARSIRPVHTMFDGDTMFALATGIRPLESVQTMVRLVAASVLAVERAVVNAVRFATAAGGLPAPADRNQ